MDGGGIPPGNGGGGGSSSSANGGSNSAANGHNNNSGNPNPNHTGTESNEEEVRAPIQAFQDQIIGQSGGNMSLRSRQDQEKMQRERLEKDHEEMVNRMAFDGTTCSDAAKNSTAKKKKSQTMSSSSNKQNNISCGGSGGSSSSTGGGGSGQGPSLLNSMFSSPPYSEKCTFAECMMKASHQKQFILVNIQKKDEFMSHQLNRDVWNNDLVQEIVVNNFVFWQRDDLSEQGKQFCQYYNVGPALPWICFIDPRTRRCVKGWEGRKWGEVSVATEFMSGFIDKYQDELTNSGNAGSGGTGNGHINMNVDSDQNLNNYGNVTGVIPENLSSTSSAGPGPGAMNPTTVTTTMSPEDVPMPSSSSKPTAEVSNGPTTSMDAQPTKNTNTIINPTTVSTVLSEPPPLPDEPPENTPNVVKVSFRLLDGSVKKGIRVHSTEHTILHLLKIAWHYSSNVSTESGTSMITKLEEVDLWTAFPKRSLRGLGNLEMSVKEADVAGEMLGVQRVSSG